VLADGWSWAKSEKLDAKGAKFAKDAKNNGASPTAPR